MIQEQNGTFYLGNDHLSLLLRRTPFGKLEQVHFGGPVDIGDAPALTCRPIAGWGVELRYDPAVNWSNLDTLSLAWSEAGRGDYRESPIELFREDGPVGLDLIYLSHRIFQGRAEMTAPLPQAHGNCETLEIVLEDRTGDFTLHLFFTLYPTALVRRAALENHSAKPVQVASLMSMMMDLPGRYDMTTFNGRWSREMHPEQVRAGQAKVVNESRSGFSSHFHNPGFQLSAPGAGEDHGAVYGFNLIYSGNHYAAIQQNTLNLTRVSQGISPGHFQKRLAPSEVFETPEAVISFSGQGFNGLSRNMHRFVNENIVPERWQRRPRPVVYNSWEGCRFDFDEEKLLSLAREARGIGCELFVLDDGWFGARDHAAAGLGDYSVSPRKLPHGLGWLAEQIKMLGLDFGLWFEPESINPDSNLYRAHPEWAIHSDPLPDIYGRGQLLLDLTRRDVREYIVQNVGTVLDSADISYVKWDMNRHSVALGEKAHDYILGLYEVLDAIFTPRPHILLEGCASGGNRFDLGMLSFAPQIWASDDTDPVARLDIQRGLSYLYPQSAISAHVSAAPHHQTMRLTPLTMRGNVASFGLLGYEFDLDRLTDDERAELLEQTAFYKFHRELFQFGAFRREPAEEGAECWQVQAGDMALVGLFHRLMPVNPGYEWLRTDLGEKRASYRITSRRQLSSIATMGRPGTRIPPEHRGEHDFWADELPSMTASGAALRAGVCLPQRFAGTGFREGIRMQSDFGSNIYVITKLP